MLGVGILQGSHHSWVSVLSPPLSTVISEKKKKKAEAGEKKGHFFYAGNLDKGSSVKYKLLTLARWIISKKKGKNVRDDTSWDRLISLRIKCFAF